MARDDDERPGAAWSRGKCVMYASALMKRARSKERAHLKRAKRLKLHPARRSLSFGCGLPVQEPAPGSSSTASAVPDQCSFA